MAGKIFLLDAYALIFRAYYAFIKNPRINSKKMNTSAIFGFVNTLEDVLKLNKPTHIAVAFDPAGPNFRHEMFPEYKANREATPENIKLSVPYIKKILEAYNIPAVQVSGFEADDVIGTMSKMFASNDNDVYMMTPDKDYGQLVGEHSFIYKPAYAGGQPEILGINEVNQKFSIDNPIKVIDVLALCGDTIDNIPGVPGIGPKTSAKLLEKFGTVEGICNNIDKLGDKQQKVFSENVEQLKLSYKLATIETNVPLDITLKDLEIQTPNYEKLIELYDELEFFKFKQRIVESGFVEIKKPTPKVQPAQQGQLQLDLFSMPAVPSAPKEEPKIKGTISSEREYSLAEAPYEIQDLAKALADQKEFCLKIETTELDTMNAEIVGMSICTEDNKAKYITFPQDFDKTKSLIENFAPIFADNTKLMIGQNLKFNLEVLSKYGIEVSNQLFDTMIAHYLIEPEQKHDLDYLSVQYLDQQNINIIDLIGDGKNQKSLRQVDCKDVCKYSCEKADAIFQLKKIFEEKIHELKFEKLFYDIEIPLIRVLMSMEQTGVKIDSDKLNEYADELKKELADIENQIYEYAGEEFNIASPKIIGEILFEKMKIVEKAKMTKTKRQYDTSEEELLKLSDKHPIINCILDYRGINKLISTYVEVLPTLVNPKTGMLHTSFNQTVTATGRLSSSNPNLQNIPIRDERGKKIRSAFTASDEEHIFFSADYSQIELRVMAHLSQDPTMLDAFNKYSRDIHTATAAKIFNVPEEEVTKEMRGKAKTANFGIIYGISAFGLGQRLQISAKDGKKLIEDYFETFSGIKTYIESCIAQAKEKEFVETMFGRRRYLQGINSHNAIVRGFAERNAVNAPIQGTAADIVKIAMINIFRRFNENNLRTRMILQVHDELNFNVPKSEMEIVEKIVVEEMQNCVKLSVPLIVDAKFGKSWLEAH